MPRQLRIQYPGAMYRVLSRGDRREDIFLDDVDRQDFRKTLAEACQKTGWEVHAHCLMRNHYHLVLETPNANRSRPETGWYFRIEPQSANRNKSPASHSCLELQAVRDIDNPDLSAAVVVRQCGGLVPAQPHPCPGGTPGTSPTFQRWVACVKGVGSEGTTEPSPARPPLRGLITFYPTNPMLKHWAYLDHPSGIQDGCGRSRFRLPPTGHNGFSGICMDAGGRQEHITTGGAFSRSERREFQASPAELRLAHDSKVFGFRVLKRERTGSGFGIPTVAPLFVCAAQLQSLEVADAQLAAACRTVMEQHLMGHEIKAGIHAGSKAHFWNKSRAQGYEKSEKGKQGHVRISTNFDHQIKQAANWPDAKVYDGKRHEAGINRMALWAGPLSQRSFLEQIGADREEEWVVHGKPVDIVGQGVRRRLPERSVPNLPSHRFPNLRTVGRPLASNGSCALDTPDAGSLRTACRLGSRRHSGFGSLRYGGVRRPPLVTRTFPSDVSRALQPRLRVFASSREIISRSIPAVLRGGLCWARLRG